jgi:transposase-like protein
MIVDRYDPTNLFELVPKLKLEMEPELARLDVLLDDDELFSLRRADLIQRHPNSGRLGRHSTPVEVILRMLLVKKLYGWSYEQTERFVCDSIVLRQFCRLYLQRAPDDTTLIRWANTIGAPTLAALNDRAVELAQTLKVTRGRKLRTDATVVETNIHYPTDDALIADGVRLISRLVGRAKDLIPKDVRQLRRGEPFRNRIRMTCAHRFDPPIAPKSRASRRCYLLPEVKGEKHMASKPKSYTPKFKFQLVLEVLQGERSEVELGRIYGVHHTTISKWKRQFLDHGAEVFSSNEELKRYEKRVAELERMIGQKEIELALLKNFLGGS